MNKESKSIKKNSYNIKESYDKSINVYKNKENQKRLTIDISSKLHSQIKIKCAKNGINMAVQIRSILEEKFGG